MKRRVALKNLALAAGGLLALPSWAHGWSEESIPTGPDFLSSQLKALLAEVTETILPTTDTPGAKDLKIHVFVQKMLTDCYEPEVQENVIKGLETVEQEARKATGKQFATCSAAQRESILTQLEVSAEPAISSFYKLVKDLTLQGYLTSEYYLTKHTNYKMIPGHFYGCVPVTTKQTQK